MHNKLRFRHIEGFRAIIYAGAAPVAAAMLNVPQAAIGQLIKEIEDIVGHTLFDRHGSKLTPTHEAVMLQEEFDRCHTSIEHANAFRQNLRVS